MRRAILPLALALMFAPALYAAGTGSISGTVTDSDNNPCSGVTVQPYVYVVTGWGSYWQQTTSVQTDVSGNYTISGLDAGNYRIGFTDDTQHRYLAEYYDNATWLSAATVTLSDAEAKTGVNAQLTSVGRIDVSTIKTTAPGITETNSSPGFQVYAVPAPGGVPAAGPYYSGLLNTSTDKYEIYDLPPGEYRVYLEDTSYEYASAQTNATADTSTKEISLGTSKFGTFSGRVTDVSGNPLAGIRVSTIPSNSLPAKITLTDASGNYSVATSGEAYPHALSFEDYSGQRYFTGYYQKPAPSATGPTAAYSALPDITNADGWPESPAVLANKGLGITSLNIGATISGTVRNAGGTALGGVTVQLYRSNSVSQSFDPFNYAVTAGGSIGPTPASVIVPSGPGGPGSPGGLNQPSPGTYKLGPLEPGDYRIKFFKPYSTLYVPEYYNDKADLESADAITIGSTDQQLTGIDAVLAATSSASPSLNVSAAFSAFATTEGSPSAAQAFTVDGSNLTSIIFIAAPAGYEVSSDGSNFGPNVSLTPVSSSVASTTLYIRVAASAAVGSVSGSLELTTAPAVMQTVAVSGTVTSNYDAWADGHVLTGGDRVGTADPDKDGFSNNAEFAFGTSPVAASGALMSCTQSGSNLVITFLARTSGATYTIETTTQLAQTWSESGIVASDAVDQNNLPANYTRKTATIPISGRAFYRIKAVAN